MHQIYSYSLEVEAIKFFQFPLLGIFPCILGLSATLLLRIGRPFNSPYLGFFLASLMWSSMKRGEAEGLSIPLTWDFSLHHEYNHSRYFGGLHLSIPLTWDFSLHLASRRRIQPHKLKLSIPLTWDFSLHRKNWVAKALYCDSVFQFPLLGIFPCIQQVGKSQLLSDAIFQFPLLGIFPCIFPRTNQYATSRNNHFQFPLLGIFPCIRTAIRRYLLKDGCV